MHRRRINIKFSSHEHYEGLQGKMCEFGGRATPVRCKHINENSTLLITFELTNQNARKALFTCVVYTNVIHSFIRNRSFPLCKMDRKFTNHN